jgi:hypothetical protein
VHTELQHYVPRFLLRRFGTGKKDRIHVYDKHTDNTFVIAAKKAAAENNFYDFKFDDVDLTLEPGLAALESKAAIVIDKILTRRRLDFSSIEERAILSQFFAVQSVRTRAALEKWRHLGQLLKDRLQEWGAKHTDLFKEEDPRLGDEENQDRVFIAQSILRAPKDYGPYIAAKSWLLLETDRKHPYIIGDHPLVLHNMRDTGPRGNIGFAVEGIELYFPLAPDLVLAMWCSTHEQMLRDGLQQLGGLSGKSALFRELYPGAHENVVSMVQAIDSGLPWQGTPDNTLFVNSLQVLYAERFIFSTNGEFSLVEDMIRDNPETRRGQRMEDAGAQRKSPAD